MVRRGFAVGLLAAVWAAAAWAQAPFPVEVRTVKLDNGLELLLAPDPAAAAVDVAVWYASGTRYERAGQVGIAHLFEHLMFRGATKYGPQQHVRRIAAEGGTFGASTSADYTCFYESLPPEALRLAFDLEADRMSGLRLTQAVLDAERAAIREERARRPGGAVGRGLERLYGVAFADHPYRWPVFGYDADLSKLTLAQAKEWYAAHFGPRNAVITVTGRFDAAEAEAQARKIFGGLSGGRAAAAPAARGSAARAGRASETGETRVALLFLGWRGPGRNDSDAALFPLLANVLGSGEDGRLEQALVGADRTFRSVEAQLDARRDGSMLYAMAAVDPAADTARVEASLAAEVERLAGQPLPDSELTRAKAQAESGILFGWMASRGRAQALGTARMSDGDARAAASQLERIRACTAADLQRAAGKLLTPARRSLVWVRPAATTGSSGGRP